MRVITHPAKKTTLPSVDRMAKGGQMEKDPPTFTIIFPYFTYVNKKNRQVFTLAAVAKLPVWRNSLL